MSFRRIGNVYIAASSAEVERAEFWANRLAMAGITVVSTWWKTIAEVGNANPRDATREQRQQWTNADFGEIDASDLVWFLVPPTDKPTRGAWIEFGYAYAVDKILIASGDTKQSIFCAVADEHVDDLEAFATICRLSKDGAYGRKYATVRAEAKLA